MSGIMIVTGGGRGIGAATARLAAARGYAVCVNYNRNADAAQALVAEIGRTGGKAIAVRADVAQEHDVVHLFDAVERELGRVTALVNNAGLTGKVDRLADASCDVIRRVIEVNLLGVMWCAREAVRRMALSRGGGGGGIVNISSGAANLGSPGQYIWYAASKGGVDSFTLGLSKEVAGDGIRVNAVSPGFVRTEIHAAAGMANRLAEDAPKVPIGRAADPEEMAEPVLWLLSDSASYTTGAILRVAGGR